MPELKDFKKTWKTNLASSNFQLRFLFTFLLLGIVIRMLTWYLVYNEHREGVVLDDPILKIITAVNLNIPIFALIYVSLIVGLITLAFTPEWLLIAIQTYSLTVIFRIILMYVTPLDVPHGSIDLEDPLVFVLGTGGLKLTRDLFFSGHTSTLFILSLTSRSKKLKYIFLISTILVGIFVMLQKVHYSVDVFVAPFVAYSSFKIILLLNRNNNNIQIV